MFAPVMFTALAVIFSAAIAVVLVALSVADCARAELGIARLVAPIIKNTNHAIIALHGSEFKLIIISDQTYYLYKRIGMIWRQIGRALESKEKS
jgi:hypothetical protein